MYILLNQSWLPHVIVADLKKKINSKWNVLRKDNQKVMLNVVRISLKTLPSAGWIAVSSYFNTHEAFATFYEIPVATTITRVI